MEHNAFAKRHVYSVIDRTNSLEDPECNLFHSYALSDPDVPIGTYS